MNAAPLPPWARRAEDCAAAAAVQGLCPRGDRWGAGRKWDKGLEGWEAFGWQAPWGSCADLWGGLSWGPFRGAAPTALLRAVPSEQPQLQPNIKLNALSLCPPVRPTNPRKP